MWGSVLGFEDRVWVSDFSSEKATFPAAGKVAGWPEDFVLKDVLKDPNGYILY